MSVEGKVAEVAKAVDLALQNGMTAEMQLSVSAAVRLHTVRG